jgi:hypothetical protein
MKKSRSRIALGLLAVALSSSAWPAAIGLVPAPSRIDFVVDAPRHVLYISGTDQLLRYDLKAGAFLAPIALSGQTLGMDISPDGHFLAVANGITDAARSHVDIIDLRTLLPKRLYFTLEFMEGGTYTVAYDRDGRLLVSSQFEGSGWVPLRKVNVKRSQATTIGSVMRDSMLTPSADHTWIAIAESNNSGGPYGRYATGDASYASTYGTGWFNYEIGISRDGNQMAVPTYGGTYFNDFRTSFPPLGQYAGVQPVGVAYSPARDRVYFPFAQTNYIAEYDTTTMTETRRWTVPSTFGTNGNWAFVSGRTKVSTDDKTLCTTVTGGVWCTKLGATAAP